MALEILLPRSAMERRRHYRCFCGTMFPLDQEQQWVRHSKSCTKKHEDEIGEAVERRQNNGFISPSDKELYAHIRQGGN